MENYVYDCMNEQCSFPVFCFYSILRTCFPGGKVKERKRNDKKPRDTQGPRERERERAKEQSNIDVG